MSSGSIVNAVFLQDQKLRRLAQLIRNHEVNNMFYITFASVGEQLQYLRMVNDNLASVHTILDDANAVVHRHRGDPLRSHVAGLVHAYVEHSLNNALQLIPNYTVRRDYLDKMIEHHEAVYEALEALNTSNLDAVDELTETIRELDRILISYMRLTLNSYASAQFSQYLRNLGISFEELVSGQQRVLGYRGRFEDLEIEQKLDVYAAILERSGRMRILSGQSEELADFSEEDLKCPGGQWDLNTVVKPSVELYSSRRRLRLKSAAMFFKDMCTIIWDIYSSDHTIQTVTRDALVTAAEKGGAALGKLVAVAIATRLTGQAATTLFITAVGLVGGFVGAFILGAVAGLLFDLIFSSGGQAPLPTDGFIVYVAPMPDGRRLARQIA